VTVSLAPLMTTQRSRTRRDFVRVGIATAGAAALGACSREGTAGASVATPTAADLEDLGRKIHGRSFGTGLLCSSFAGDVGTGKTALAERFGDAVAQDIDLRVTLFFLSLNARGTGVVGDMTTLPS
jgi:hypothetical protein